MSASPEFAAHVMALLDPVGQLVGSRLFGGYGIKQGPRNFAIIMGNTLYFRVNDDTRPDYEQRGMKAFSYSTKKRVVQVRKYFAVPEALLEDPQQLVVWARAAIAAAAPPAPRGGAGNSGRPGVSLRSR